MDIAKHLGAVTRVVTRRDYKGQPAVVVVATRTFPTDPADLWDAITSAERIPRWFLPVTGELKLGGRYQLKGNAEGTVMVCDPPRRLELTWEFGGQTSWVHVTLTEDPAGGTQLVLEHIAHFKDDDRFWAQYGPGAVGVGWDLSILALAHYVAGAPMDNGDAWSVSEDGKAYMRGSSESWRAASVAFGTDPTAAAEAAANTTAFYTGGQHQEPT